MLRKRISTIAVLLLVAISMLVIASRARVGSTSGVSYQRSTNANVSGYLKRDTLVRGSHVVKPGGYIWWEFYSPGNESRVEGRFRAEGGSGNDIIVFILDEDAFENWRNGHSVNTYYNSGKVTVGRMNVQLPEGKFFLVFSNKMAIVSNKVVTAEIDLIYRVRSAYSVNRNM